MAKCKGCGQTIEFVKMPSGRHMPVDPRPIQYEPGEYSGEKLVTPYGEIVYGQVLASYPYWDPARVAYRPHWGSCPQGTRFKAEAAERAKRAVAAERDKSTREKKSRGLGEEKPAAEDDTFVQLRMYADW